MLSYPAIDYHVPPEYLDRHKLNDRHALSTFRSEQIGSKPFSEHGWQCLDARSNMATPCSPWPESIETKGHESVKGFFRMAAQYPERGYLDGGAWSLAWQVWEALNGCDEGLARHWG